MRIRDIKCYPVWVGRNQLVVKVETDEGIYGLGESGLSGRELAVMGAIDHFREFLIGKNPMQMGRIWQELYRSQYFEGGRVLTAAQSAIDLALYDIAGKALGIPVHQLLGGHQRDTIPASSPPAGQPPTSSSPAPSCSGTTIGASSAPACSSHARTGQTSSSRAKPWASPPKRWSPSANASAMS